jgi:hypothetical protein
MGVVGLASEEDIPLGFGFSLCFTQLGSKSSGPDSVYICT